MKRKWICFCVSICMLSALLLQGCAKKAPEGEADRTVSEEAAVAMGRYVEEEISLPAPVGVLFDLRCGDDGTVWMLFEHEPGSLYLYESGDAGASWDGKKLETDWLPEDYRVGDACVDTGGAVFACAGKMSEDPMAGGMASGTYRYFLLDASGEAKELSLKLPAPKEDYPVSAYGLSSPALSADGKIYGMLDMTDGARRRGRLFCFDADSGGKLWDTDTDDIGMKLFGDELYVYVDDDGTLVHIDRETGEKLEETACDCGFYNLDIKPENNKIYCSDRTGIYGTDLSMEVRELLVDGGLGSFGSEDYGFNGLVCVSGDCFLLPLVNSVGEKTLFRYEYDPDVPTRPDNELTVYTLKENYTAQQLVSDFRRQHPETYVHYEVGMQGSGAENVSDVMNTLNTEIMAGNGPDVLILNNLPWESYAKKGILADLGGCCEKSEVFENLFLPYEREGILRAAPVTFKIPIAAGEASAVAPVHSAEELLKVVEDTREDYLPFLMGKQSLVRYLFSVYWQTVQEEDGSLSGEQLKRLLEIVKRIQEHIDASTSEYADVQFTADDDQSVDHFDIGCSLETDTMAAMSLTYLESTASLVSLYNHIQKKDMYEEASWQAISEGVFSPLLVGISQKSERMELAEEFVRFSLGEEEQASFASPEKSVSVVGFPVNQNAWKRMIKEPSESELEVENRVKRIWPPQEVFADVEKRIRALETPAMEDSVVIDAILDVFVPCLNGEKNLDTAADEIMEKLELYRAERSDS